MNALRLIIAAAAMMTAASASAAAEIVLVNGTGNALLNLSYRPSDGGAWQTLGSGTAGSNARQTISIPGEKCAFDIRATLAGREVSWADVNFCDAKVVTLHRRPDGTHWADYD